MPCVPPRKRPNRFVFLTVARPRSAAARLISAGACGRPHKRVRVAAASLARGAARPGFGTDVHGGLHRGAVAGCSSYSRRVGRGWEQGVCPQQPTRERAARKEGATRSSRKSCRSVCCGGGAGGWIWDVVRVDRRPHTPPSMSSTPNGGGQWSPLRRRHVDGSWTLSWSRTPRRRVCVRGWYDSATEVQRAPTASVSRPMPHALRNRIRKRGVTASRRVWSAIDWVRPHRQAPCLTTSPPNVRGNSSDPATRFCGGAGSGG
jgi:hypothetical protein